MSTSAEIAQKVRLAFQVGLACFAAVYLLGFVGLTMRHARMGYFQLNPVRSEYIQFGFWLLVPLLVGGIILVLYFWIMYHLASPWRKRRGESLFSKLRATGGRIFLVVGAISGMSIALLIAFAKFATRYPFCLIPIDSDLLISAIYGFIPFIILIIDKDPESQPALEPELRLRQIQPPRDVTRKFLSNIVASIFFFAFVFGTYLIFSVSWAEKIPSELGGGALRQARLVIDANSRIAIGESGLKFGAKYETGNYPVLFEDEKELVLVSGQSEVLVVRKSAIIATRYVREMGLVCK